MFHIDLGIGFLGWTQQEGLEKAVKKANVEILLDLSLVKIQASNSSRFKIRFLWEGVADILKTWTYE